MRSYKALPIKQAGHGDTSHPNLPVLFLFNFLLHPLLASDNKISYKYIKSVQQASAMNLDDGWKFILADGKDFSKPDFDDSAWEDINLPDDWAFR